jgi:hypothetical protein
MRSKSKNLTEHDAPQSKRQTSLNILYMAQNKDNAASSGLEAVWATMIYQYAITVSPTTLGIPQNPKIQSVVLN